MNNVMSVKNASAFGGKISISYPPLSSNKGTPTIGQNRQFQWFSKPTYIYPVIPAYAASLLKSGGYDVFWDDGVAQQLTFKQWLNRIINEKPDIIAIETKTPIIKQHWKIINELKKNSKFKIQNSKFILMGDHVCARPKESLENSAVDYVLAHGDYDFGLLNLANYLEKGETLEGGFWFRDQAGNITNSGAADISRHNLDSLPLIDRELTRWKDYAYKNGNFKYVPGSYIMSARDCWWGKCSFCSWASMFPGKKYRTMSAQKALDEVGNLISLGVREIMEDSGTLPNGNWLKEFCEGMIDRGYNKQVKIGCNMRVGAIRERKTWQLMKRAGFRFCLFGLESANQETLDRINKNVNLKEIEPSLRMCRESGLEPHATFMIGYPWENRRMVQNTLDFAKKLLQKRHIESLQATLVVPYPGTLLFEYCENNGLLLSKNYDDYDQKQPVMKSDLAPGEIRDFIRRIYFSAFTLNFVLRKIRQIRSFYDIKILIKSLNKWLGKLGDYK